jgi:hypothetical protein
LTVHGSISGAPRKFTPMLFQAAIACLILLSVRILIAHAIDAFRSQPEKTCEPVHSQLRPSGT